MDAQRSPLLDKAGRKRLAKHFMREVVLPCLDAREEDWFIQELAKYPHDLNLTANVLSARNISVECFRTWGFLRLRGKLPDDHAKLGECMFCRARVDDKVAHLSSECAFLRE